MGYTVDGKAMTVKGDLQVEVIPMLKQTDAWESGSWVRRVTPFGGYRKWSFSVVEDVSSLNWADSVVKYLKDKAAARETVTLSISTGTYTLSSQSVTVLSVTAASRGGRSRRVFTVVFQEVM